jgi:hypothetical protein
VRQRERKKRKGTEKFKEFREFLAEELVDGQ